MYKVEIDQTLRRIIQIFYQFGCWRNEDESDFRKSCMRLLHLAQYTLFLVFVLTSAFLSDDKIQQIFLLEVGISVAVIIIKISYLLYRKDEILEFLYDPSVTHCITNYAESVDVNKKIKKIIKFIQVYTMIINVGVSILVIVALPIFTNETTLPFFIRFDVKSYFDMILYWVAFVYTTIGCLSSLIYNCAMVLIWYIMYNYSIEYKILGNQFRRLGYTTKETRRITARNLYHQDLIGLIKAHNKLFDTIERFRSCFSTIFLAEIVTGGMTICGSAYNLAYNTPENVFHVQIFANLLIYAFFEIFVIMYLGEEISIESDRLSYCLFESNWTEQSESTKKSIIVLCETIKKPQQLKIFIYPINLEKFVSIVNGAYSMFNILQSFN